VALMVAMLGTWALPAWAAPPGREDPAVVEEARALVRAGNKLFEQKRYDDALTKYSRAFEIRPTPNSALNLALTHQALKNHDEALTYARRYLQMAPDAKDRAEVKKLIRQLEKDRASAPRAPARPVPVPPPPPAEPLAPPAPASPSPAPPASPTALTPPTPVAAVTPPAATAPVGGVAVDAGATAAPSSTPWYRRWYVWAGAAVVVGAVVAGSVAGTRGASIPSTEFGHQTVTLRGP
jgi:tetratricopeptide (TPR) repeat protein